MPLRDAIYGAGFFAFAASMTACGAAGLEKAGSRSPETPAPRTIEDAQAQIADARAELGLPPSPGAPQPGQQTLAQAPPSPPPDEPAASAPPRASREREAAAPVETADGQQAPRESPCARMCRALASMRRASEALCRLAGDGDARCLDGRRALAESEAKVRPCGC